MEEPRYSFIPGKVGPYDTLRKNRPKNKMETEDQNSYSVVNQFQARRTHRGSRP